MTVLAELTRGLVSIQCDLCVPPVLTINTLEDLRRTGWALRADGVALDVCPTCAMRVPVRQRVRRADPVPVAPDPARLPNVVVVGATKAGTTSMHSYLGIHPDISISTDKEGRFFQDPDCRDWIGRYQDNFATGTRFRAEATPFYSKAPCYPGVVDAMADIVPDARIIYLVRDPLERILAEYVEQLQWVPATRTLDVELADAADPRNWLVASSRYATQLAEFRRRFDADRIMVIDLADVSTDAVAVMGSVFDFLDLPGLDLTPDALAALNTRAEKWSLPPWLHRLRGGAASRALYWLPDRPRRALTSFVRRTTQQPVPAPVVSDAVRRDVLEVLGPEVQRLREMTGQDFATWAV